MTKDRIQILGGGPAGAAAALAALRQGSAVRVVERPSLVANARRHKVCGEFFSPEIEGELESLGAWAEFAAAGPAVIRRMVLHFGARARAARLPDPGWGLSRHCFDGLLLDLARGRGAELEARAENPALPYGAFQIVATGRRVEPGGGKGERNFGFKAHFEGPADDAVELFFFKGCYVGVNCIEDGRTNVCGLGPERELKRFGFHYDELVNACEPLRERLGPLRRCMPWISTGPLEFKQRFAREAEGGALLAGDALSFVDPFTGSGLLAAVRTGALAGEAAAKGYSAEQYLSDARRSLKAPFQAASFLRLMVRSGWADRLVGVVPGPVLFALTRPR